VRVFISSTFRDMHAETGYLNRFALPNFGRRACARVGTFLGVYWRWGITEEKAKRERLSRSASRKSSAAGHSSSITPFIT